MNTCVCVAESELPCWLSSKELACNAGDPGWTPGLGRWPGGGHGNPLAWRIPWTKGPGDCNP